MKNNKWRSIIEKIEELNDKAYEMDKKIKFTFSSRAEGSAGEMFEVLPKFEKLRFQILNLLKQAQEICPEATKEFLRQKARRKNEKRFQEQELERIYIKAANDLWRNRFFR